MKNHNKMFVRASALTLALLAFATPALASEQPSDDFLAVALANENHVLSSTPEQLLIDEADTTPSDWTSTIQGPTDDAARGIGSGYLNIECSARVDAAHLSNGAGGAIFKTYVRCIGSGAATVTVRQRGLLSFAATPTSTLGPRATSDYSQNYVVNGAEVPFYTPKEGNAGHGSGYWVSTSTWQITVPGMGSVGSDTTTTQRTI
jgi:hypothetical protein